MKTRKELEDLAANLGDLLDGDFTSAQWKAALILLNDLHSEGMRDAATLVQTTIVSTRRPNETEEGYFHRLVDTLETAILTAIENKPKL